MLSRNVAATPRPRPPAKARRASAGQHVQPSPSPPCASQFALNDSEEGSGSTSSAMASRRDRLSSTPSMDGLPEDWANEVSRQELSEILQKADGLIKERANELVLASAVAKKLYRNSATLKGKHEALLSRFPASPVPSAFNSPESSRTPLGCETPLFYSSGSIRRADSFDSAPSTPGSTTFLHPFQQTARPRRTRKISVSPADIALLSDQNAELMQKLERLEADSAHADLAGRRKLSKLEKDIQFLREELERTMERSDALEEKASKGFAFAGPLDGKRERQEMVRVLRGQTNSSSDEERLEGDGENRDFAPASGMPRFDPKRQYHDSDLEEQPASLSTSTSNPSIQSPSQENDIIAQLLQKVQELEETNIQITSQQADTTARLAAVQRDAENIGKLYDLLGGQAGMDLEIVVDGGEDATDNKPDEPDTIRFNSLRRTLEGDLGKAIAGGTLKAQGTKSRKSVVGYFVTPTKNPDAEASHSTSNGSQTVPFPSTSENSPGDGDRTFTSLDTLPSAALSPLGILTPHSQALHQLAQMVGEDGQTLESELGSDFGTSWGNEGLASHHLRNTSLYELNAARSSSSFDFSRATPTPAPWFPSTPGALQLTEDSLSADRDQEEVATPSAHAARYKRMSRSIRMRSNRWADGRFKETMLDQDDAAVDGAAVEPMTFNQIQDAPPAHSRLASAVDIMSQAFDGDPELDIKAAHENHPRSRRISHRHARSGFASGYKFGGQPQATQKQQQSFILELWLWLQFAVIILVFLWAMARRGPKSVLEAVDRKAVAGAK